MAGLQRQPVYLGIVIGKRKFHIGLMKLEVAHKTGSLSLIRGEIRCFFGWFLFFTALLVTSGFYGDATRESVSAGVYCNDF